MKYHISTQYKHFILLFEIAFILLLIPIAYNFVPLNDTTKTFYIASSKEETIIQTLKNNGYEVTWIDKILLNSKALPTKGWYTLKPEKHGRFTFFRNLHRYKTSHLMDVVIYAGETKEKLCQRLANDMKLDEEKLLNLYLQKAQFKEADILSGSYTIARKADEKATITYLFDVSQKKLDTFEKNYLGKTPDTLKRKTIFVIASIIQKESNFIKEMPYISSVIYNRLEKKMKLQMDATLNYGKYAHQIVTPERIKTDTSYYNTYKHKGLPPHPLGTVSLEALQAAVRPAKSDYLFFMLNKDGSHNFSSTYVQHLKKLRAFRAYQKEKRAKKMQMLEEKKSDSNKTVKKSFGLKFDKLTFKKSP